MKVVIIGHGGHSKVVSDNIRASKDLLIIGYLDNKYENIQIIDHLIYGPIGVAKHLMEENNDVKFVMAIGDNRVRKSIIEMLGICIENFVTLIHPTASISPSATIGKGTVVMPQAVINADVKIGHHCIINSCSVVEHDSLLEDFVHLCPNSTIAGTVEIGEGTCVGSGATIIPTKRVGEWSMIGAGSTVTDDLPDNCLAVGTPAKVKLKNKVSAG
ncbi:acetyltransferase EpsM [Neobacillus niacini]|uniref:acetyltransferase n=1 Tax=Neobacillus niacini TaxID=86668 RepID=UPI00285B0EDD|nr:acetyltransferase [Neobacillus niacini]MDR7079118.1 acetyltransferase EpsM [Neobacillus niacini]